MWSSHFSFYSDLFFRFSFAFFVLVTPPHLASRLDLHFPVLGTIHTEKKLGPAE